MRPDAGCGTGSGIIQAGELGSPAFYCAPMFSLVHWDNGWPHGRRLATKADARARSPAFPAPRHQGSALSYVSFFVSSGS